MWKVSDKFNAIGTSGAEYVIVEMTDGAEDQAGLGRAAARRYVLEDGSELSAERDGTFIVVETDEVLKATAPSAPVGR